MKSRQIMFFGVLEDFEGILKAVEATIELQYYRTGLLESGIVPCYDSIFDTSNVGITLSGDWNDINNYLVIKKKLH